MVLALALMLVLGGVGLGWFIYEGDRPLVRTDNRSIELAIPYGTSARGIAKHLRSVGVDAHETMFVLYARWLGVHRSLKAGVYVVEPGMTKKQLILRLAGEDPTHVEFRIIEGWTVKQVLEALAADQDLRFDLPAFKSPKELAAFLQLPAAHPEGWLYADAYWVPKQSSAAELLRRSARFQQELVNELWAKRRPDLPYQSLEEALVVASIVEKETQYPGDREKVAAVFANRVRVKMPLQADPTVIYGLGERFDGNLTKKLLRKDTPYNTYTRKTLPPTPISNPGRLAIRAVMNPADSRALYFVARGDGSSEFSETLAQHNAAVNRFIRRITGD